MGWPHLRLLYTLCPLGVPLSDWQQVLNGITWLLCVGIQGCSCVVRLGLVRVGVQFEPNPSRHIY